MAANSTSQPLAAGDSGNSQQTPLLPRSRILFYGDGNAAGLGCGENGIELQDTYPFVACEACHGAPIVSAVPGRATVGKHPTLQPELRGAETFLGVLVKYTPVKGVVFCLGTNDVLGPLNLDADKICFYIAYMVGDVRLFCGELPMLLVSPPPVAREHASGLAFTSGGKESVIVQNLAVHYAALARRLGIGFFDGSSVVPEMDAPDGWHLTKQAHRLLGEGIGAVLQEMLETPAGTLPGSPCSPSR